MHQIGCHNSLGMSNSRSSHLHGGILIRPHVKAFGCLWNLRFSAPRIHERRKLGIRGDKSLRQLSAFLVTVAVLRRIGFTRNFVRCHSDCGGGNHMRELMLIVEKSLELVPYLREATVPGIPSFGGT